MHEKAVRFANYLHCENIYTVNLCFMLDNLDFRPGKDQMQEAPSILRCFQKHAVFRKSAQNAQGHLGDGSSVPPPELNFRLSDLRPTDGAALVPLPSRSFSGTSACTSQKRAQSAKRGNPNFGQSGKNRKVHPLLVFLFPFLLPIGPRRQRRWYCTECIRRIFTYQRVDTSVRDECPWAFLCAAGIHSAFQSKSYSGSWGKTGFLFASEFWISSCIKRRCGKVQLLGDSTLFPSPKYFVLDCEQKNLVRQFTSTKRVRENFVHTQVQEWDLVRAKPQGIPCDE